VGTGRNQIITPTRMTMIPRTIRAPTSRSLPFMLFSFPDHGYESSRTKGPTFKRQKNRRIKGFAFEKKLFPRNENRSALIPVDINEFLS
jgi:hypothetical protein